MSAENQYAYQKVAFLDTNMLHYIGTYLGHAREANLYPWIANLASHEEDDAIDEAKGSLDDCREDGYRDSLKRGLSAIGRIRKAHVRAEYSLVSALELLSGRARGKAVLQAAAEGVPERMWSRFPDREVGRRVTGNDLREAKKGVDGIAQLLREAGIEASATDAGRMRDVIDVANALGGVVFLSAMDSVIYANALAIEADYLLTADRYVRWVVNCIRNPDNQQFSEIKVKVEAIVRRIVLLDGDTVRLPEVRNGAL